MWKSIFLAFATIALTACAVAPSKDAAQVRDADEKTVSACQFLQDLDGSSGWGGLAQGTGMANARTEVREKAAKIGATHIVWHSATGGAGPYITGRAYKCA